LLCSSMVSCLALRHPPSPYLSACQDVLVGQRLTHVSVQSIVKGEGIWWQMSQTDQWWKVYYKLSKNRICTLASTMIMTEKRLLQQTAEIYSFSLLSNFLTGYIWPQNVIVGCISSALRFSTHVSWVVESFQNLSLVSSKEVAR
jgi:hypothetical protein